MGGPTRCVLVKCVVMKKFILSFSLTMAALTAIFAAMYRQSGRQTDLSFAIVFGIVAYHFCVRLLIVVLFKNFMDNRADWSKRWYQIRHWEKRFYQLIHVKQWKQKMPIYEPQSFDPAVRTWDEIVQAMCQAELVHETNVVVSFVPIVFGLWVGALPLFVMTSLLGAVSDLLFVFIQRYNRPRVIRMMNRYNRRVTVNNE